MDTKPLAILSAGGTGGHMFPAQALAEELLARGWDVKLSTDLRGARFTKNFPEEVKIEKVASATFAKQGLISKIKVPFFNIRGCFCHSKSVLETPASYYCWLWRISYDPSAYRIHLYEFT